MRRSRRSPRVFGPIRRPISSWLTADRGSITVVAAGALFLAGVLTLAAVDLLRTVQARATAQTAADAAALAAAQEIAIPSGRTPQEVASEYAARNGASLLACTCQPGTAEAVVEVEAPVDLVFVGRDRTVRGRARAVIEGAKPGLPGTMAADAGSQTTPTGQGPQAIFERPRALATADPARRGGLYAGQAGPPSRMAAGGPLPTGDLRRPPRTDPGRPIPRGRSPAPMPCVRSPRAPPPRLRLR